jgi:hypothetical protein
MKGDVRLLRKALLMCAASCQGGSSDAGKAAAVILEVPFPIRMDHLIQRAHKEGFNPVELWPWHYENAPGKRYGTAAAR